MVNGCELVGSDACSSRSNCAIDAEGGVRSGRQIQCRSLSLTCKPQRNQRITLTDIACYVYCASGQPEVGHVEERQVLIIAVHIDYDLDVGLRDVDFELAGTGTAPQDTLAVAVVHCAPGLNTALTPLMGSGTSRNATKPPFVGRKVKNVERQ